jgi:phosphoserine phosphatase RsbU/P
LRYRWKLLVLLLVIALVPIVTSRLIGVRALKQLGYDLVSQLRESRVATTKRQLALLADNYVAVLGRRAEMADLALLYQTRATEKILARSDALPGAAHLARLTPVYNDVGQRFNDTLLWQHTALINGLSRSYPMDAGAKGRLDIRVQCWYRQALEEEAHWSTPYQDPVSAQSVIATMMKIRGPGGSIAGVSALVFPISKILPDTSFRQNLPPKTDIFMVDAKKKSAPGNRRVKVISCKMYADATRPGTSISLLEDLQLPIDVVARAAILKDFETGRGNTRQAIYGGRDSFWVYRPIFNGIFIVFITPYQESLKPSQKARAYVEGLINDMVRYNNYGLLATILVVIGLALAFSRTVTKPIRVLLDASLRLGEGDLNTRVDIRSQDEFGDLGRVFNSVVTVLKRSSEIQQSIAVAVEVQQNLIPKKDPIVPGLDIAGKSVFCEGAGGDYYDYIVTEPKNAHKIGLAVGDVSDHGLPSALLMATARAALRQRANQSGPLSAIVTDVNRQLSQDVEDSGRFMSLFFCEIDAKKQHLTWVRAGHDPALIYDSATETFNTLEGEGLPLGVFEESSYEQLQTPVQAGQILIIGTDGIWETRRSQGDLFGKKRLKAIVQKHAHRSAKEIVEAIFEAVAQFCHPLKPDDDVTLVVAKIETPT